MQTKISTNYDLIRHAKLYIYPSISLNALFGILFNPEKRVESY